VTTAEIPNRPLFRAQEVCEIAQVQPYVLRSWEAEFPDLGVAKKTGDARMYRRADVERVLQLKHLLFVDGLTLAGARKRLAGEATPAAVEAPVSDADVAAMLDAQTRTSLREVRRGLQWILGVLGGASGATAEGEAEDGFVLSSRPVRARARTAARRPSRPARAKVKVRKATKSRKR